MNARMSNGQSMLVNRYGGMRVVILGAARQGLASARFFLGAGARVTVSDLRQRGQLATAVAELEAHRNQMASDPAWRGELSFALGGHPESLLDGADLLCLSGGVSPGIPLVQLAIQRGIPLTNDSQLTLEHCPAPVIGITGSAGKTTTTTVIGLMLSQAGFPVHVGGNIGMPLLDRLERIGAGDKVVLELSSFQLELMSLSPRIAGLLNITPNHLDRHPSMGHYAAAKSGILRFQSCGDTCVLNAEDSYTGSWYASGRCHIDADEGHEEVYFPLQGARLGFALKREVANGAFLRGGRLVWRRPGLVDAEVCDKGEVRLRGEHNLANLLAACCVAGAAGATASAMGEVARNFGGVEHRLEIVRVHRGVTWVNDSIATAPERTMAALRSFTEPLVVLLGGRDKHLPWEECARELRQRARQVILFGEAAGLIEEALAAEAAASGVTAPPALRCPSLTEAVEAAARQARQGYVVLLAPGCTSYDAYEDFAARGRHFRELVEALP